MAGFDEQAAAAFLESTVGLELQSQWAAASRRGNFARVSQQDDTSNFDLSQP